MTDNTVVSLNTPQDPLTELIRQGARDLIAQAVEAELQQLLAQHQSVMVDGKQAIVRNGFLPERTLQTGVGDVEVQIPKVRDRSRNGVKFNSNLIPPYLKRTKSAGMLSTNSGVSVTSVGVAMFRGLRSNGTKVYV